MKNKTFCAILAVFMALALTACGSNEAPQGEGDAKPVTITILNNKIEIEEGLKQAAASYTQLHPDVHFEIVSLTADPYNAELKTRFAGGEEPDIFALGGYSDMVLWKDKLEDLSDQSWTADMVDFAYSNIDIGGIYGMPVCVEGGAYMYHKDIFADAGIEEVPKTFSELKACIEKLQNAGYTPLIDEGDWYGRGYYCINYIIAMQEDPMRFIAGLNAGDMYFKDALLAKDIMDYWKWECEQIENMLSIDFLTQVSVFGNKEAAITFGGNWNQTSLDDMNPDLDIGMFPVPMFEEAEKNDFMLAGVTTYWGVNKGSQAKDEAKLFMEWLVSSSEGQKHITRDMLLIPAFKTFSATAEEIGPLGADLAAYINAGKVKNFYGPFYPEGGLQTFGEDMQRMLAGKCSVEELLDTLDADWQKLTK